MSSNDTVLGNLPVTVQCFTPSQIENVLRYELTGLMDWASLIYLPLIILPAFVFSWVCGGNQSHLTMPILLTLAWTALAYLNFVNFFDKRLDVAKIVLWTKVASSILFIIEAIFINRQALLRLRAAVSFSAGDAVQEGRLKAYYIFAAQLLIFNAAVSTLAVIASIMSASGLGTAIGFTFPPSFLNIFPFIINLFSLSIFYVVERFRPFAAAFVGQIPPKSGSVSKRLADFLTLSAVRSTSTLPSRSLPLANDRRAVYIYSLLDFLPEAWRLVSNINLVLWTIYLLLQVILVDLIPLLATNIFTTVRMLLLISIAILVIAFARNPGTYNYAYAPDETTRPSSSRNGSRSKPFNPFMNEITSNDETETDDPSIHVTEETTRVEYNIPPSPKTRAKQRSKGSSSDAGISANNRPDHPEVRHTRTYSTPESRSMGSSISMHTSSESAISSMWTQIEAQHAVQTSTQVQSTNINGDDAARKDKDKLKNGEGSPLIRGLSGSNTMHPLLAKDKEASLNPINDTGYPRLSQWTAISTTSTSNVSRSLTGSDRSLSSGSFSAYDPDDVFQKIQTPKPRIPLPPIRIPRADGLYV